MRKLILVVLAVSAMLFGTSGVANAMRDPIIVCVRECSPLPQLPELPPLP